MGGVITRALGSLDPVADRETFGDKAVLLGRAIQLGLPVPPALAIDRAGVQVLRERASEMGDLLGAIEGLAEEGRPLVVSVRPSTDQDRPGSHATILDVGAGAALEALEAFLGDRGAALDARLRFLRGLARVRGVGATASVRGVRTGAVVPVSELERENRELEAKLALGPQRFADEVTTALEAVARYGEPIVVQAMRFGTSRKGRSGAGTASSRHPITGERLTFGEIAWDRQGEDVSLGRGAGVSLRRAAAGRRAEESLEARLPAVLEVLEAHLRRVEQAMDRVVDLELAVEAGVPWVLQLRETVLTPRAEVRSLVDRAEEGAVTRAEAIARVAISSMVRVGRVELVPETELPGGPTSILGRGLGASPGAASGKVVIDVDEAVRRGAAGARVVLVRSDASPEDAPGVRAAVAVATAAGGLTSHAAVMSRALGRPCAVSVSSFRVQGHEVSVEGGRDRLVPGELVTVDGTRGLVVRGVAPTRWVADDDAPLRLAAWARELGGPAILVDDDGGGDGPAAARALNADGVWNGRTAIDLSGSERQDWGAPPRWDGASGLPKGPAVVVAPLLVAAARVAATRA
ncbi:MAG: PEP-utilizing enzyme [Sandaracinus sp.]